MKRLRTLGLLSAGAFVLSAAYALALKDRKAEFAIDDDKGRSISHIVDGDRGDFSLRDDDRKIKARWRGDFTLDETGNDIATLERSLEIEIEEDGARETAEFDEDDGEIERTYYRGDDEQAVGPETDAAIKNLLLRFLRASGMKADERVAAIMNSSGAEGVLDEIAVLDSDHARRRYILALTEAAELSDDGILRLADELKKMESDHDLSRALRSIIEHQTISETTTPALIAAADSLESDHDTRKVIEAFAETPLNDASMTLLLALYESLDSDHDTRVATEALLESDSLSADHAARILIAAAAQIDSNHDMRLVLTEFAPVVVSDEALLEAWLKGFGVLDSSHDQRLAIVSLIDEGANDANVVAALLNAVKEIDSSHDQRVALQALADLVGDDETLRAAYRDAAASIDSESDRERALGAIGE
ncbi:MAG: hypothetical protein HKN14_04590 [Marinicaulis sp.]|nr:hypothetical protein [Marinicaulis sp.]